MGKGPEGLLPRDLSLSKAIGCSSRPPARTVPAGKCCIRVGATGRYCTVLLCTFVPGVVCTGWKEASGEQGA
jgi:hypothetical protein